MSYLYNPQPQGRSSNSRTRNSISKLNSVRDKFHEVIDLCKGENQSMVGELGDVVNAEKQILGMLNQYQSQQSQQAQKQSYGLDSQQPIQPGSGLINPNQGYPAKQVRVSIPVVETPLRQSGNGSYVPESQFYIGNVSQINPNPAVGANGHPGLSNHIENNYPANISRSNIMRPDSSLHHPASGPVQPDSINPALQSSFNMLKNSHQIQISDDAMHLIEEIERKAFNEIEALRAEKLQLMQSLNQEIRQGNELKKRNLTLENALQQKGIVPGQLDGNNGAEMANIKAYIQQLQRQLQQVNSVNINLQNQLSNKGVAPNPDTAHLLEELLRQGEQIRQETLRLIKLKQESFKGSDHQVRGDGGSYYRKENTQGYSPDPKNVSQADKSYGLDGYSKISRKGNDAVGHYEDLVSEMRRITGY